MIRFVPLLLAFAMSSTTAHGDVKCKPTQKSKWKPHTLVRHG